jgi:prefoldin subunit 5
MVVTVLTVLFPARGGLRRLRGHRRRATGRPVHYLRGGCCVPVGSAGLDRGDGVFTNVPVAFLTSGLYVDLDCAGGWGGFSVQSMMNRLMVIPALIGLLLLPGCQKTPPPTATAAEKALSERLTALEEQVERLRQMVVAVNDRRPSVTQPRSASTPGTNVTAQVAAEHRQYEQVMQSLAEAVEGLQQQEQGMTERLQTITDAIVSLEQALLSIDAEVRQMRVAQQ